MEKKVVTFQEGIELIDILAKDLRIQNISFLTHQDFYFVLSNKDIYLLFSLIPQTPFLATIPNIPFLVSNDDKFAKSLKSYLSSKKIRKVSTIHNQKIIKMEISGYTASYKEEVNYLYFECFSPSPNIIVTSSDNIILCAYRYHSLEEKCPLLQGLKYVIQEKEETDKELLYPTINFDSYFHTILLRHKKEKYKVLFDFVNKKPKSLENKIFALESDKEKAVKNFKYKDFGDYLLYSQEGKDEVEIDGILFKVDKSKSKKNNVENAFNKYKKAKRSLPLIDEEITKAKEEKEYFDDLKVVIQEASDEELLLIYKELIDNKYLKNPYKTPLKIMKNSLNPYYVVYKNTKIVFGKNNMQNDNLSFNLIKDDYPFIHIKDYPGSHIYIKDVSPSDEVINAACQLAILLSKKEVGEVSYSHKKDIKKGKKPGQVILKNFKVIKINKIDDEVKELLKTMKK